MKPCPHCGKELPEEMGFCPYCMEKLIPETPVGVSPSRKKSLWWLGLVAAVVLLTGLAVWRLWPKAASKAVPAQTVPTTQSATEKSTTATTHATGTATHAAGVTAPSTGKTSATKKTTKTNHKKDDPTKPSSSHSTKKTGSQTQTTSSKTNARPCADGHDWVPLTKTVHHEETGHYEQVQKGTKSVTVYKCPICYEKHDSLTAYYTHFDAQHADTALNINVFRDRYETDTELRPTYEQVWVVDEKGYDETITVGRHCRRCGKTEQQP